MKASGYAAGSLLTVADLTVVEVAAILGETDRIERMAGADRAQMLAGRRIALLFYESSTRTRTSFELAAKSLGAITTLVSDKSSSIEKGESLKDTGLTLRALGAECIILRHANSGAPYLLAKATGLPVGTPVNGASVLLPSWLSRRSVGVNEKLAREGKISELPRMGAKLEEKVLRSIAQYRQRTGRYLLSYADNMAAELADVLRQAPDLERIDDDAAVAGTVGGLVDAFAGQQLAQTPFDGHGVARRQRHRGGRHQQRHEEEPEKRKKQHHDYTSILITWP